MKHQAKRIMSMALALVMIVSLFSGMTTTAFADNTAIQGNNGKTVAFIENGVLHSVQTVAAGTEIELPNATQSVDAAYGFQGWAIESIAQTAQKPATVYAAGSAFTVNDHQVFYALYEYQAELEEEEIPEETTPVVTPGVTDPYTLPDWDIDTVQLPAHSIFWNTGLNGKGTATGNSQNGTIFKTNVTFPANMTNEAHYVNFWIGEEGQGYVLAARPNSNTIAFLHYPTQFGINLDPAVAGVNSFYGQELEVMISTEFVNTNGDVTDVNVGLYINGALYNDEYLKITGAGVNDFPQNVFIISNTDVATTEVSTVAPYVPVTSPEQLEGWNVDTVQLPMKSIDCFAGANGYGIGTGKSQNGTSFNAKITFPGDITNPGHYVNFWIGEEGNGYIIQAGPNKKSLTFMHFPSNMSVELYPEDFGMETLVGTELTLNLTTEFFNTNGNITDVHTGLYINGKLYKNRYITINGTSTTGFPQDLHIVNNTAPGVTLVDVIPMPVVVTSPAALESWDIDTVQLPMKSIDCFAGANGYGIGTGKSQNGTSFNAKITFPGDITNPGHYVNFWIGEEGNGYIIQAGPNKKSLTFMHFPSNMSVELYPEDFGMETLVGTELTLNLTTEFFNTNGDTTDVHTGLYINGKLYKDEYITIQGTSITAFPQDLHIVNNTAPGVTLVDVLATPPEQLESWDVDTVQLPMKSIDCFAGTNGMGTATGKSQNGTSFNAKITFPGDMTDPNHYVNFWIGEEGTGYVIQAAANKNTLAFMHFPSNMNVELQPADFGMETLVGAVLDLNLTTEFFNTNGDTTDVHTGLYINGKLYKDSYITIRNTSTAAFPQNVHILNNAAPGVTLIDVVAHYTTDIHGLSCEHSETEDTVIAANCSVQGYTCTFCNDCQAALSAGSFTAIGDHNWREWTQTALPYYGVAGEETRTCGICGETQTQAIAAFENPVASWNIALKEDISVNFVLALTDIQAEGATVTVAVSTDAKTENVSNLSRDENGYYVVSQAVAAAQMTETINVTVKMSDNEVTNSYTVRQYADYILDEANGYDITTRQLVADMLHYGAAAQTYFNVNTQNLADNELTDLNTNTVPAVSEQTDVQITGEVSGVNFYGTSLLLKEHIAIRYYFAADNADSLEAYTFTVAGQEYTPVKKDNLYYVQIDNVYPQNIDEMFELTVTDGTNTLTVAYSAISYISRMYDKNSSSVELKVLLQQLYDYHISAEGMVPTISSSKKKITIAGFMGPSRVTDNNRGVSYDYITDEIYGMLSDLGINLINASANDYASAESRDAIIEALQMGEQHNIDFYVMDARLTGNLSEAQVRNYMKGYSSYSAFKGVNLVDEPSSDNYPAGSTDILTNYATVSTMLNNMDGVTGYGNLLPWYRHLGSETAYRNYVNEYIQTCHPQVLSFDNYPFDNNLFASRKAYVSNLSVIRDVSQQYNIPFWSFVQAGSNWNNSYDEMAPTANNSPTEAELRWSVNASLAYGAQGIEYFPLIQPYWFAYETNGGYDYARNGLIGANGEKTQWYGYAKKINQHVNRVSDVLMEAMSVDLLAFGTQAMADTGITKTSYGVLNGVQTTGNVIVGCFEYNGKDAFYVVNHNVSGTQNLTLQFAKNVNYSVISDQIVESLQGNMVGASCNLTLNAGGAALIIVD